MAIIWRVLKAYFAWKQLKADYSKNIWKRKKLPARFCLFLGFLHISENELFKTAFLLVERLMEEEKEKEKVGLTLTFIFPILDKCEKGKLYILNKVDLSTFKKILKNYVYKSTLMFFNIFLFCWKPSRQFLKHQDRRRNRDCIFVSIT